MKLKTAAGWCTAACVVSSLGIGCHAHTAVCVLCHGAELSWGLKGCVTCRSAWTPQAGAEVSMQTAARMTRTGPLRPARARRRPARPTPAIASGARCRATRCCQQTFPPPQAAPPQAAVQPTVPLKVCPCPALLASTSSVRVATTSGMRQCGRPATRTQGDRLCVFDTGGESSQPSAAAAERSSGKQQPGADVRRRAPPSPSTAARDSSAPVSMSVSAFAEAFRSAGKQAEQGSPPSASANSFLPPPPR